MICFGKEAPELAAACSAVNIPALATATLEEGFAYCMQHVAKEGDDVLSHRAVQALISLATMKRAESGLSELVQSLLAS